MKKTRPLFIFIFIIALIAVWLGATAWIGARIEPEMRGYFARLARLNGLQEDAFHVERVQHTFFTSKMRVTQRAAAPISGLPRSVDLAIEHGPIFWRRGAGLGLARIHAHLSLAAQTDRGHSGEGNASTISAEMVARVGWDRQVHLRADVEPFVWPIDEGAVGGGTPVEALLWSDPATVQSVFDPYTFAGKYRIDTPRLGVRDRSGATLLEAETVALSGSVVSVASDWFTGEATATMGRVRGLVVGTDANGTAGWPDLTLELALQTTAQSRTKVGWRYRVRFAVLAGALPAPMAPVRSGTIRVEMSGLVRSGIASLMQAIRRAQQQQAQLTQTLQTSSDDPSRVAEALVTAQTLPATLKRQVLLTLPAILERNATRLQIQATLATRTHPDNTVEATLLYTGALPTANVEAMAAALAHPVPALFTMDARAAFGTTLVQELGGEQGKRYAAALAAIARQGWLKRTGDRYSLSIHYDPRHLILNGRSMPMILMGLKLIQQGGAF